MITPITGPIIEIVIVEIAVVINNSAIVNIIEIRTITDVIDISVTDIVINIATIIGIINGVSSRVIDISPCPARFPWRLLAKIRVEIARPIQAALPANAPPTNLTAATNLTARWSKT